MAKERPSTEAEPNSCKAQPSPADTQSRAPRQRRPPTAETIQEAIPARKSTNDLAIEQAAARLAANAPPLSRIEPELPGNVLHEDSAVAGMSKADSYWAHVRAVVDTAPPLTAEQRLRLQALAESTVAKEI